MDLTQAIETFNQSSQPPIEMKTTRDGRVVANLPRLGKEIIVEGSPFNEQVRVTAADVALLCEEARLASAPGVALLTSALDALAETAALPANR